VADTPHRASDPAPTPSTGAASTASIQHQFHIVCQDLFKIYKIDELEVVALRGLDIRVQRGELMAIVGSSGSGKSTLLNILAGLDLPSAGAAYVNGRDLITMGEDALVGYRRTEVGFVWQQTGRNLIPYLSARQNIEVPMILSGLTRGEAKRRSETLLEAVGISDKANRRPEQMSGGEQQRVSIGVALANQPPLLLADEPTGELDTHTSEEIFDLFASLNSELGVTVIIVTHDPAIAARVDRVVAIRDGRIATETFRHLEYGSGGSRTTTHREYTVVDRSGRLQIPPPYVEALDLHERARVFLTDDHVSVYPEDADPHGEAVRNWQGESTPDEPEQFAQQPDSENSAAGQPDDHAGGESDQP
jgi:ABC-type lipoprotein export system ATPase subunit